MKRNKHKHRSGRSGGRPPATAPSVKEKAPDPVDIVVTDHAVIRFLERVMGVDIAAIRRVIATEQLRSQAAPLGGYGVYPSTSEGLSPFWLLMKDFVVVTITLTKANLYRRSESVADAIARKTPNTDEIRTNSNL